MYSLGNISGYTFHGACWHMDGLVSAAADHGYQGVGLSDYGGFRGGVAFSQTCERHGVNMILGCRLRVSEVLIGEVQLTVRNRQGYGRLNELISRAVGGVISWDDLEWLHMGDVSGFWLSFPVRCRKVRGQRTGAYHVWLAGWERLCELAGETLWVEMGWHTNEERLLQRRIYGELSRKGWTRWVLMSGARHLNEKGMYEQLDLLQSIGTLSRVGQRHPDKLPDGDYSLKRASEVQSTFRRVPELFDSTRRFVEACDFDFDYGKIHLPMKAVLGGEDDKEADRLLSWYCLRGIVRRYGNVYPWRNKPPRQQLLERLKGELKVISVTGYAGYFLIFREVVVECARRNIPVLARGSAAGSLICYALGVANVCPFRFGLSFERFLNLERMRHSKLPDIDLDLPWDRRDEITAWLYERFGEGRVAMIGGFNTFRGRASVAEVGKALGIPPDDVYKWTRRLPHGGLGKFVGEKESYVESQEVQADDRFVDLLEMAQRLDGLPRHPMQHPCGVVIADCSITRFMPVEWSRKGHLMTQMDMDAVEDLGLLKMDLLGQAGLSVIRDCQLNLLECVCSGNIASGLRGADPRKPFHGVRYDAPCIYEMIRTGGARGVFHIESPAMTGLLRLCQCADIDCLVATVSVIRPGAANEDKKEKFARRYLGLEEPVYIHPDLEPVLKDSYGLLIYEEHILYVANVFAGMDFGTADLLRRILVKKTDPQAMDELESVFFSCARAKGRSDAETENVWRELKEFSGYMFNKAHGAAYAVEAFQGCWLKANWPLHFLAAVLNNQRGFYRPIVYVLELLRHGAELRLPDVQQKRNAYYCEGHFIQLPLWCVSGLSHKFFKHWDEERQKRRFSSWDDFVRRTQLERKDAELLARSGALRSFFSNRHEAFWMSSRLIRTRKKAKSPIVDEFSYERVSEEGFLGFPDDSPSVCAEMEVEVIGYPVSVHPVAFWMSDMNRDWTLKLADLNKHHGQEVEVSGIQVCARLHRTRKGKLMKFISIADESGIAELILFPDVYEKIGFEWSQRKGVCARIRVEEDGTLEVLGNSG